MSNGTHRPQHVIERDSAVAVRLLSGPTPLRALADELGLTQASAYRSLWRLRKQGLVDKSRDGSRTPVWQLNEAGVGAAQAAATNQQPLPVAPEPAAEPTPEPVPVAPESPPEVPSF